MVDGDPETAIALLTEPAIMVSGHGVLQFTRDDYRKMANQGPMVVTSFKFDDLKVLFPNDTTAVLAYRATQGVAPRDNKAAATSQLVSDSSTWVKVEGSWKCVMHTETPFVEPSPSS